MQLKVREYTMQTKKHASKIAIGFSLFVFSTMSYAEKVDVTPVTSALSDGATTVATVCAAALGVVVVVKVFKYIRSAL